MAVKKKSRKKQAKKFFVKEEDGIFVVKEPFFEQIPSRAVAIGIALRTWHQLRDQLCTDAIDDENTFIGNMLVTTGLERTLVELDRRFPFLLREIRSVERRHEGRRVYSC